MGFAILDIEKIKTNTSFVNRHNHDFRLVEVANADKNKIADNKVLVECDYGTYLDAYKSMVDASPIYQVQKVRKNAVRGIDVVLTYSHESVGQVNMEEWERISVEWLQKTFGKENVVSVVEHNDESTPHIHAIVIPMVKGRLNASSFLGGKQKMTELQSSYAKAVAPLGLKRGTQYSKAKAETMQAFYGALNKAVEAELPEPLPGESAKQYRERANQIHKETSMQTLHFKKKSERVESRNKAVSLTERFDFEEEKRKFKEANKEAMEIYEKVLDIQDRNPGFPVMGTVTAVAQAHEYLESHPEDQQNVITMFNTLGKIMKWEEEEKEKKQKKHHEKDNERTL